MIIRYTFLLFSTFFILTASSCKRQRMHKKEVTVIESTQIETAKIEIIPATPKIESPKITTIDVKPALTGVTATASAPGCSGDNISLTSSLAGAKSYEWSGTPSFASSVQNPTIEKPMADNYTFTVKVTSADGCTALATASTAISICCPLQNWQANEASKRKR